MRKPAAERFEKARKVGAAFMKSFPVGEPAATFQAAAMLDFYIS
jgi:hypothetical protein